MDTQFKNALGNNCQKKLDTYLNVIGTNAKDSGSISDTVVPIFHNSTATILRMLFN